MPKAKVKELGYFRFFFDRDHPVICFVELDLIVLAKQARRATKNQTKQARIGALKVTVQNATQSAYIQKTFEVEA